MEGVYFVRWFLLPFLVAILLRDTCCMLHAACYRLLLLLNITYVLGFGGGIKGRVLDDDALGNV